jgi:hypothetical protein
LVGISEKCLFFGSKIVVLAVAVAVTYYLDTTPGTRAARVARITGGWLQIAFVCLLWERGDYPMLAAAVGVDLYRRRNPSPAEAKPSVQEIVPALGSPVTLC